MRLPLSSYSPSATLLLLTKGGKWCRVRLCIGETLYHLLPTHYSSCHIIIFAIIMIIIVNMMKQKSTMPIAAGWWWWCWWWWWWESNWVGGGGSIWSRERAGNIAERMSARPIVALLISPRLILCTSQAVWSGTILNSFSISWILCHFHLYWAIDIWHL